MIHDGTREKPNEFTLMRFKWKKR